MRWRAGIATGPSGHSGTHSASDSRAPYVVAGPSVRVPLVLEDETGRRHVRQWTLGLN